MLKMPMHTTVTTIQMSNHGTAVAIHKHKRSILSMGGQSLGATDILQHDLRQLILDETSCCDTDPACSILQKRLGCRSYHSAAWKRHRGASSQPQRGCSSAAWGAGGLLFVFWHI